jgi:hypothetical protein
LWLTRLQERDRAVDFARRIFWAGLLRASRSSQGEEMMTDSMETKREYLISLYPGRKWRRRVLKMKDDQVTAIYLREQKKRSEKAEANKNEEKKGSDDIPF